MKIYLYNDAAFKWFFGRQERTGPISSVLNSVVGHDGPDPGFGDIRILNPFDITKCNAEKQGILDLRVRDDTADIWFDVEMQVRYQDFYPERSMFYLAGMYRDQLKTGDDYHKLRPCCGVHFVMADVLKDKTDWFSHFRMLNVKNHKPLSKHWEMYFVALGKFRKAVRKHGVPQNALGQWCDYMSKPHDSGESLDESFKDNEGIREVHEMLREFTEDERLREQYRLHEAWLADQRTSERTMGELRKSLLKAESEKRDFERRSVLALRKAGQSDKSIAGLLGMSESEVGRITDEQPG